jgi:predicted negative regulator of RcsB-dependent stress response
MIEDQGNNWKFLIAGSSLFVASIVGYYFWKKNQSTKETGEEKFHSEKVEVNVEKVEKKLKKIEENVSQYKENIFNYSKSGKKIKI